MVAIKLIMVGDAAVGKTSYIRHIKGLGFSPSYLCTIGIDFYKDGRTFGGWSGAVGTPFHDLNGVSKDTPLEVYTWDTAGQERYYSLSKSYFKGIQGAFICFDLTHRQSFDKVDEWIRSVKTANGEVNFYEALPIVLLGMKRDLKAKRQVSSDEAMHFASKKHLLYFETSSKTGINVHSSYEALVQAVLHCPTFSRVYSEKHLSLRTSRSAPCLLSSSRSSSCCVV